LPDPGSCKDNQIDLSSDEREDHLGDVQKNVPFGGYQTRSGKGCFESHVSETLGMACTSATAGVCCADALARALHWRSDSKRRMRNGARDVHKEISTAMRTDRSRLRPIMKRVGVTDSEYATLALEAVTKWKADIEYLAMASIIFNRTIYLYSTTLGLRCFNSTRCHQKRPNWSIKFSSQLKHDSSALWLAFNRSHYYILTF
jgi:hypothetical protein